MGRRGGLVSHRGDPSRRRTRHRDPMRALPFRRLPRCPRPVLQRRIDRFLEAPDLPGRRGPDSRHLEDLLVWAARCRLPQNPRPRLLPGCARVGADRFGSAAIEIRCRPSASCPTRPPNTRLARIVECCGPIWRNGSQRRARISQQPGIGLRTRRPEVVPSIRRYKMEA